VFAGDEEAEMMLSWHEVPAQYGEAPLREALLRHGAAEDEEIVRTS